MFWLVAEKMGNAFWSILFDYDYFPVIWTQESGETVKEFPEVNLVFVFTVSKFNKFM